MCSLRVWACGVNCIVGNQGVQLRRECCRSFGLLLLPQCFGLGLVQPDQQQGGKEQGRKRRGQRPRQPAKAARQGSRRRQAAADPCEEVQDNSGAAIEEEAPEEAPDCSGNGLAPEERATGARTGGRRKRARG